MADPFSIGDSSNAPDFTALEDQTIWQPPTQAPQIQQLVDQLIAMPTQVAPLPPMTQSIQPMIQPVQRQQGFPSGMVRNASATRPSGGGGAGATGGGGGGGSVGGGSYQGGGGGEAGLRDAAYQAGFRGQALETAVAVGMAESGGHPGELNDNPRTGDLSYGDWQINMLGGMGPERRAQYGLASNDALFDPNVNARVAFQMSGGGRDWTPWSTYKGGAFRQFLNPANANFQGGPPPPPPQVPRAVALPPPPPPSPPDPTDNRLYGQGAHFR